MPTLQHAFTWEGLYLKHSIKNTDFHLVSEPGFHIGNVAADYPFIIYHNYLKCFYQCVASLIAEQLRVPYDI